MSIIYPNATPPGSLADYRVGADTFRKMRRPQGIEIVTFTPLPYNDGPQWTEHVTKIPAARVAAIAERLVSLLRDDRIYTGEPADLVNNGDVEIRLLDPFPNTQIALFLKQHRVRFHRDKSGGYGSSTPLLDPIGQRLLTLIRQNAPTDERVKRLSFTPAVVKPPTPPEGMPKAILHAIQTTVRPGMRRGDILRVLSTEGGVSSRLNRQYVYPKPVNTKGQLAKVQIGFVPANIRIRWIDGVGYPINPPAAHVMAHGDERSDDIVITVSQPYLQYGIAD